MQLKSKGNFENVWRSQANYGYAYMLFAGANEKNNATGSWLSIAIWYDEIGEIQMFYNALILYLFYRTIIFI